MYIHNGNCVTSADVQWGITKSWIDNWTSLELVMVIWSACLLISWLNTYAILQTTGMLNVECGVVNKIWQRSPISFKHVSLWCSFSDPHWTTHRLNIGVWLRKVIKRITPTYRRADNAHLPWKLLQDQLTETCKAHDCIHSGIICQSQIWPAGLS